MNTNMVAYYNERAKEYEQIYLKPERQDDLLSATSIVQEFFTNKNVLEIACGTGYWTERIAKSASSVYATDINEAVLEIAREKDISKTKVSFGIADIFNTTMNNKYQSLFGGFIWSHIPLQKLDEFLNTVSKLLLPGGTIVFMDNTFVANSNLPIACTDEHGNTFQERKLADGSIHIVMKNFPDENFLRQKFSKIATGVNICHLKHYWILSCSAFTK